MGSTGTGTGQEDKPEQDRSTTSTGLELSEPTTAKDSPPCPQIPLAALEQPPCTQGDLARLVTQGSCGTTSDLDGPEDADSKCHPAQAPGWGQATSARGWLLPPQSRAGGQRDSTKQPGCSFALLLHPRAPCPCSSILCLSIPICWCPQRCLERGTMCRSPFSCGGGRGAWSPQQ